MDKNEQCAKLQNIAELFESGVLPSKLDVFKEIKKNIPEYSDEDAMLQTYRIINIFSRD